MADLVPWVFTSGWASGVNAYAVVVVLGLLGRFAGVDAVPAALERTDILVGAAVLYALEFVVDKIPWLDSAWDAAHTAIRPAIGAALGLLLAGDAGTVGQALAAAGGGLTALASHGVKAGLRAAINTSPEPASNIVTSVAEDTTVAGVIALVVVAPWVAAAVAAVLLAAGTTLVFLLVSRIRRGRRRRAQNSGA
jgi:energy-converting hydrogenase Eha subunit C